MSVVEPGSATSGLIDRVKNILLKPKETWAVIDGEAATVGGLYKSYVIPLAAIPAVCGAIGSALFGVTVMGMHVKTPLVAALVTGVIAYLFALAMVYVMSLIIDFLAPNFGGTKNPVQAFKVVTYAYTAGWVAGIFTLLPALAPLTILAGLYGLYLLYLGLPKLMKTEADKALPYPALVIVAAVVMAIVVGVVTGMVTAATGGLGAMGAGQISGEMKLPGGSSVDLGKLQAASKQLEAAANQMENGTGADGKTIIPTDPEVLKAYLPAAVAGFARGEVSTGSGGVGGMQGSSAKADYSRGEARLTLSVTDLGAAGAFGAMASAFNISSSSESGGKSEKVGRVDGRMTQQSYDKTSKHGEYSVLAGDRFMIQAEGSNVTMDELKAAVAAVNPGRMEQLAKAG